MISFCIIHHQFLQFWYHFHLSHYRQFPPKLPPQHTENGQSLQFPPIRILNLRGWPFEPRNWKTLLFSDIPNDVSEWYRTKVARNDWLIEHSVWVQRSLIPSIPSPHIGPLIARRLKTSANVPVPCRGRLNMLKIPSCPWHWVPGSRSKFGNWTTVPSPYSWNIAECDVKPQPTNDLVALSLTFMLKRAIFDFVATVGIVFHKHILFNLVTLTVTFDLRF